MNLLKAGISKLFFLIIAGTMIVGHLRGQSPSAYYDISKQRLLALSAAQFITNVTQGAIEADSAQLFACRIYGFDRLLPYTGGYPDGAAAAGSQLIGTGNIPGAKKLEHTLRGVDRIRLLLDLGIYYLFRPGAEKNDLDSSLAYFQQARTLSSSPGMEKWNQESWSLMGEYYHQAADPVQSKLYFSQVIKACEQRKDQKGLALAWENAGKYLPFNDSNRNSCLQQSLSLYQQLGLKEEQIEVLSLIMTGHFWSDWSKAGKELQQLLDLQTSIGYRHVHFVHYVMGYLKDQIGDHLSALDRYNKALESMKATGDTSLYSLVYQRIGSVYAALEKPEEAITWFKKGLSGPKSLETQPFWYACFLSLVSTLTDLSRFEEALSIIGDIERNYPAYTLLEKMYLAVVKGYCYEQLGQMQLASENFDRFAPLAAQFPPQYVDGMIPEAYFKVANFEFGRGNYGKARDYLEKAKMSPSKRLSIYDHVSWGLMQFRLDSLSGNYLAAIKDYIQYTSQQDTLSSLSQKKQLNELMIKNETEKKDHNIALLTQNGRLQQAELHQANFVRNVMVAGGCLLLTILALLFYQYRMKHSANRIITDKNRSMQALLQEKESLLQEKEGLLEDKEILMKEIHHRVKNNLHMISSLLESQSAYLEDEALFAIQKSQHRVQAISLIHQKLYVNDNVTDVLMSVYLREIVSYLRDSFVTNENIIFNLDLDPVQLDVSLAVPLGLIVNEAITNSIKYAFPDNQKGQIGISLKQNLLEECSLCIADNGIGLSGDFDFKKNNSLGMSLISGLSKSLHGNIKISSGAGTKIELIFMNAPVTQVIS